MNKIWSLFITFFKIGAFTFGGGYAMIPLIQNEVVEKKKWMSDEDILDIVAIAETTPGPIAINSATFVGTKVAGFFGSAVATLGVVLPSFIIITIISYILEAFQNIAAVQFAFNGIRAGVLALVFKALISMYKKCPKDLVSYIVMAFAFLAAVFVDISVIYVLIACAAIGLVWFFISLRRADK